MAQTSEPSPKSSKAQSLFQYGNEAALKGNFDYAIAMYRDALKIEPGNLQFRQALRGTQRRVYDNEPKNVGRLVGMKTQPIKAGLKASKARSRWADVLESCEDVFKHNPWDVGASEDAADAAEHLGYNQVSQWLLESVAPQAGDNEAYYIRLAHAYEINERWDQAIGCWEKANRINPANEEAKRKVRALSANATMTKAKYAESIGRASAEYNTRRIGTSPEAEAEAEELKRNVVTPEQRLEKEIEDDPTRVGPYLHLADIHKSHNRLDEAEKILARGRKAIPDDDVLKTAHGDIQLMRLRRAIEAWKKKVRDNPEDRDAKTKLAQIQEKHSAYELAEFRRRVESNPTDSHLHMTYGRLLASSGKHDEAISEFQKARNDPELKVQALQQAGLSFEAKGLAKLAEKNLAEALALSEPNQTALRNALRYRLGRVCEVQGKLKEAEEYYNEVAAEDYSYEDVAKRLEDLISRGTS